MNKKQLTKKQIDEVCDIIAEARKILIAIIVQRDKCPYKDGYYGFIIDSCLDLIKNGCFNPEKKIKLLKELLERAEVDRNGI